MKTTISLLFCFLFFVGAASAQSVTISPNSLDLPRVSSLSTCNASTKGRMVYTTTDNRMYYCNGTAWINTEVAGPQSEPAFSAYNTGEVNYTAVDFQPGVTIVPFSAEYYDISNNFSTNGFMNSNTFVAPANGVYHFDASGILNLNGYSISNTNQVSIHLMITAVSNGFTTVAATATFVPIANANFGVYISRDLKLAAGDKVKVSVSDDIFGTQYIASDKCFFNGHLATKY
jgi:hypothetical protein